MRPYASFFQGVRMETVTDHQQLYDGWRRAFDRGETDAYREPVASIVENFRAIFQAADRPH